MSDKIEGFRGRTIEDVQSDIFLRKLPAMGGRYHYQSTGLSSDPGTLVLFQFQARIIASAIFARDEKFDPPQEDFGGILHFDPASFRTFHPLDIPAMRKICPAFRAFGHVKQFLNPTLYSKFNKHLKDVQTPTKIRSKSNRRST
jgi:hypothetical protein